MGARGPSALLEGTELVDDATAHQALLEQREHVAGVMRLRKGLLVGLLAWQVFLAIDWLVVTFVVPGPLAPFLALRLAESFIVVSALLRLRRTPAPSPLVTRRLSALAFSFGTIAISMMCIVSGGLESHYAAGVIVVVCAWGIFAAGRWTRSLSSALLMGCSYPAVLLVSAFFVDDVAQQLHRAESLTVFATYSALIAITTAFSVLGGHTLWNLRRQLFESRTIGRYRLLRRIGVGGSSEVWEARHQGIKRTVAMKILRTDLAGVEATRFQREIEQTIALTHPNTIRIFDYGVTEDGFYYYTMELLDGQSLRALAEDRPVAHERALNLMVQVCRALAEAHGRGVVHRDIKPANVVVTDIGAERDVVKLLDFGIATKIDADATLTEQGWIVGSPHFISPEVACGGKADARSDVYSTGATLYFLLAGRPPFAATSVAELLRAHVSEVPRPPSTWRDDSLPPDLEGIVLRCLAKDPARRYVDARALCRALEAALERANRASGQAEGVAQLRPLVCAGGLDPLGVGTAAECARAG